MRITDKAVWNIASDLGLPCKASPDKVILQYCCDQIEGILTNFPHCASPAALLEIAAASLGTSFEVISSDAELHELQNRQVRAGELGFAVLDKELSGDVFGVTYRRMVAAIEGQRPFISVIDCRGDKASRSYFTKWHELGHLLILGDDERSSFKRTHSINGLKDPEEVLVDMIAARVGFYPSLFVPAIGPVPGFADLERVRTTLCPESSLLACAIAYVQHHPGACLLIEAKLCLKKKEQELLGQYRFDFCETPASKLRVTMTVISATGRQKGLYIPQNYRVPDESLISLLHRDATIESSSGHEDLGIWASSDGRTLPLLSVHIEARRYAGSVLALVFLD